MRQRSGCAQIVVSWSLIFRVSQAWIKRAWIKFSSCCSGLLCSPPQVSHSRPCIPRLQAEGAEVEELRAATAELQEKVQGLLQATQQKDQQLQQVGRSSSQQEQLLEAFSGRCAVAESEVCSQKGVFSPGLA